MGLLSTLTPLAAELIGPANITSNVIRASDLNAPWDGVIFGFAQAEDAGSFGMVNATLGDFTAGIYGSFVVPEPASLGLLACGFFGLLAVRASASPDARGRGRGGCDRSSWLGQSDH
jgi:hypothetical protein